MRSVRSAGGVGVVAVVAVTVAGSVACGPPKSPVTTATAVDETCVGEDGSVTTQQRLVVVTFNPAALVVGRPMTATIDLPDFDEGDQILAQGRIDVMLPLAASMFEITAFGLADSPSRSYWSVAVEGHTLHLSYRPPIGDEDALPVRGVPPVFVTGRIGRPGQQPWPVWSSYETALVHEPQPQWAVPPRPLHRVERCTPDDAGQSIGTFRAQNPSV